MTPRSIRRAAERKALKRARQAENNEKKQNNTDTTPNSAPNLAPAPETPTPARLAANRENASLSTGPSTELGKSISSRNALKTGLTGRTVLLPTDDAARYQTHLQSYADHFQPAGPEEHALTQSIADTTWRLARIPGLERAIFAQGRIEFAEAFEEAFAQSGERIPSALVEAQIYLAYEKQLRNFYLQEARLVRRRDKETTELRRLQQERIAKGTAAAHHPSTATPAQPEITRPKNTTATGIGFVFANDPIAPLAHQPTPEIPLSDAPSLQLADAA